MKKTIFIVIMLGMFGWAIFAFVNNSNQQEAEEENLQGNRITTPLQQGSEEVTESDEVGLEQGQIAPDFEVKTLEGDTAQLSDYRGERVFLNFWATWCPPCRAEIPDMQKLYDEKDVEILAVNMTASESGQQVVADFVDEFDMTFPVLMDPEGDVLDTYQVVAYPTTYMIDSNGRTQFISLGAMNHDQMLQQLERME
ncbi:MULTISPECIES: redoxin domain-containing protein [Gracilibacillus]|uniref:redoxin domain-containing protein n=1 Tax=Gracilibacillus TaxID=74385 RepID=UPI0008269E7B|nr:MULTISPECIES: redoxin domain-containing protein [Gracilibacillus]